MDLTKVKVPVASGSYRDETAARKASHFEAVGFRRGRPFLGRAAVCNHPNETESPPGLRLD